MLMNQEEKFEKLRVLDFLDPAAIVVDLAATNKRGVLEELTGLLSKTGKIKDPKAAIEILMERERLGSTGIGQGIAIPHAKTDQTTQIAAAFGLSRRGVNFEALDGEPVHIFFLLVAPPDAAGLHLKALARISRLLKDKFFRQSLRDVKDTAEVVRIIKEEDQY
jgi:PTS system nitrogen regulatory IIA component